MSNEAVIRKIQKLLALATSSNEHEAKLAMEMAEKLLINHNIDMQQVKGYSADYDKVDAFTGRRFTTESKFAGFILREFFFVEVINCRNRRTGVSTLTFVGEKTNLQVATYVYDFLTAKFQQLFKEYQRESKCSVKARQSYYIGLYKGLKFQLAEARAAAQNERGLVLVADPNLPEQVRNLMGATTTQTQTVSARDVAARQRGEEQGRALKIARAI